MRRPADALAKLFRDAGRAHHAAFQATNGDDPAWPEWYAAYLTDRLSRFLGIDLNPSALAHDLRTVYHEQGHGARWPEYYAGWFRARYSAV